MKNKLGPAPTRSQSPGEELTPQRAAVLELVQHSAVPLTSSQVAAELGLHHNTAREHLDALVERDLIDRAAAAPAGRGRPAWRYHATADGEPNPSVRGYAGLVGALSAHIRETSKDPSTEALDAGMAWGRSIAHRLQPTDRDGRSMIIAELDTLGFEPRVQAGQTVIELQRCPLLDAARRHPEIVCNVHLGLVRGVIETVDCDDTSADLDAFAVPGACLLHIEQDSEPGSELPATINREEAARR